MASWTVNHCPFRPRILGHCPRVSMRYILSLSLFQSVIQELNRLGMVIDLSHSSVATAHDAITVSEAPVIFSHSSAQQICNSTRNVPDHLLKLLVSRVVVVQPQRIGTRGQWPYRLRSTKAMAKLNSNCGGFRDLGGLQTASDVQIDLRLETSNLDYPGIHVHIASYISC